MHRYLLLLLLAGCQWSDIGLVSTTTHNEHIMEAQNLYGDAIDNQAEVAGLVYELAHENAIEAKADDDDSKFERAVTTKTHAKIAMERSRELAHKEWKKAPESSGMSGILQLIMTLYGGGTTMGLGYAAVKFLGQSKQVERLKEKGRSFAKSTDQNELDDDFR